MKEPTAKPTGESRSSEIVRLLRAIEWALGTNGRFRPRPEGKGNYWWRVELAKRAGIYWDGNKWAKQPNH